jgi:hypothetical protein
LILADLDKRGPAIKDLIGLRASYGMNLLRIRQRRVDPKPEMRGRFGIRRCSFPIVALRAFEGIFL